MSEYKIVTFWSPKDNAYVGICPEFEGLAIVGKSRAAVTKDVEAAIQDYIEIFEEDGIPLPQPASALEYSGQVRLRMSRYVHQQAAERAEAEGISLNTFLNGAIEGRLAIHDFQQRLLGEISNQLAAATVNHIQIQVLLTARTEFQYGTPRIPAGGSATQLAK